MEYVVAIYHEVYAMREKEQPYGLQNTKVYPVHLRKLRLVRLVGRQFAHDGYINHIKHLHATGVFVYYERKIQAGNRRLCRWS